MEESSLEFTSHPVSQHICYTIQKKCLILHFPFTVAPCFLCFLFPSHNVTQYTKCWKNSCCLIKKDSINEISNIHSIINLLNYLYLERNLNICHYGNDLGRGGKSVRICVCVCISICLHIQVCIYMLLEWKTLPFLCWLLIQPWLSQKGWSFCWKKNQVLLPTVIILAGFKNS